VRLIDLVVRQGHLSEQALIEAVAGGERPVHLDRCDICAERAVEIGRWMDDVQRTGTEAADAIFTPERLNAQQSQILRRLEQVDNPARVITFPAASRSERATAGRRVSASWVGIAAAAGLVIGLVGGQMSARLNQPVAPPAQNAEATATSPVDAQFLDESYDQISIPAFEAMDQITPRLTQASIRKGG
jgi:hypothetical protein